MSCTHQICERKDSVFSIEISSRSRCIGEKKFDLKIVLKKEMKLSLTIWISMILTQEVFSSTLVRVPRNTLAKPTSSVHTEYEATYEQKGKLGNGSYSSVSGKQEVVHDNCGDNWNAFADKCATLIKDLVASLANAVSSKPGDATNLQLRIRNTFKHIDNTDNCTCLNHTANGLSGVDLASLFDNITISTVPPTANKGAVVNREDDKCRSGSCSNSLKNQTSQPPSQHEDNNINPQKSIKPCDTDSCGDQEKLFTVSPVTVQKEVPPNLASVNAKDVDPEFSDTSKELSTKNSRRQTKNPEAIESNPLQLSDHPGATTEDPEKSSPPPSGSNKILNPSSATPVISAEPNQAPTEDIISSSQPQDNIMKPAGSTPQQNSVKPDVLALPAKNNNVAKSDSLMKPASSVPSSASQISSPQEAVTEPSKVPNNEEFKPELGQISGSKPAAQTPVTASTEPFNNIAINDNQKEPNVDTGAKPFAPTSDLVHQALVKPPANGNGKSPTINDSQANQTPLTSSVAPYLVVITTPKPKTAPVDEDCSDELTQTTTAAPAQPVTIAVTDPKSPTNCEGECSSADDAVLKQTPVDTSVRPAGKVVDAAVTEPPVASTDSEDCTEEKGDKSDQNPKIVPVVPNAQADNGVVPQQQTPLSNSEGSDRTPMVIPAASTVNPFIGNSAEPQNLPAAKEDTDEGKDSGLSQEVVKPMKSFQDAPVLGKKNSVSPYSGVTEAVTTPSLESDCTKDPAIVNAFGYTKPPVIIKDSTLPEDVASPDSDNVMPGSAVKQPKDDHIVQKSPSSVPSVINSNSKLSESSDQVSNSGTENPSPIYEPLSASPSPIPSSNNAVNKKYPNQPTIREQDKNVFIVTPIPAYLQNTEPVVVDTEDKSAIPVFIVPENDKISEFEQKPNPDGKLPLTTTTPMYTTPLKPTSKISKPKDQLSQSNEQPTEIFLTTPIPVQPTTVYPVTEKEQIIQQHPFFPNVKNKKDGSLEPQKVTGEPFKTDERVPESNSPGNEDSSKSPAAAPVNSGSTSSNASSGEPAGVPQSLKPETPADAAKETDLTKPTTFQTTSTDPTPPQKSIQSPPLKNSVPVTQPASAPQDSDENNQDTSPTSPHTLPSSHDDDDDDEDCCSCESCTEEEITNPKQYKEMACKDLEQAKKELKAIFDKIKKKLKCGRKTPQKIVAS